MEGSISNKLINWYLVNKRDLPWRNTSDPYLIWVSEIILQQTRVAQGMPYYYRFIEVFSSVAHLASAPQEQVLKLWQGLGYYSRARNMHLAAKQIVEKYNGLFPDNFKELLKLKGVGEYTAAAVASLAYNEIVPVVDGNVIRVLSRIFGIEEPVDKSSVLKEIKFLATDIIPAKNPALHNQAIMEFGALQCVPLNPECNICPVQENCLAFRYKKTDTIPFKKSKVKVKDRFFYYFIIHNNTHVYFQRRQSGDIWEGLFEFPLVETKSNILPENIPSLAAEFLLPGVKYRIFGISESIKHILTHQKLFVCFIHINIENLSTKLPDGWLPVPSDKVRDLAVPRVIDRYMDSRDFNKHLFHHF
ncbi:MAG: A/G-specific adenine glycosylase [Bacteroidales bacterium]|nr:A/G-specific adenine glycosylase [Bacteroidales bacterium]